MAQTTTISLSELTQNWYGKRLSLDRQARGWRQRDVAQQCHIFPGLVSEWEQGKVLPAPKNATLLATIFDDALLAPHFHERLRLLRARLGLGRRLMAKDLCVHRKQLQWWERHPSMPRGATIQRFITRYTLSPLWLMGWEDDDATH